MKKKIILVEHDLDILFAADVILKDAGYEVESLPSAIPIIDGSYNHPDLFILDKRMPDIDGLEVCRHIRDKSKKNTPIIVISASRKFAPMALEAGANDFLEKPFEKNSLLNMVEKYAAPTTLNDETLPETLAFIHNESKEWKEGVELWKEELIFFDHELMFFDLVLKGHTIKDKHRNMAKKFLEEIDIRLMELNGLMGDLVHAHEKYLMQLRYGNDGTDRKECLEKHKRIGNMYKQMEQGLLRLRLQIFDFIK
jgi:CheY-like chemotaxis protein